MKLLRSIATAFENMRIGVKLIMSFMVVLMLTGLLGLFAILMLSEVNKVSDNLAAKWLPGVGHTGAIRIAMLEVREFEQKHARAADASYMAEYEDKLVAAKALVGKHSAQYVAQVAGDEERKLVDALGKSWAQYLSVNDKVIALGRAGKQDDARDIGDGAAKMALDESVDTLDRLTAYNFEQGRLASERSHAVYVRSRAWAIGLVAAALVIGLVLAWVIRRDLLGQLGGEPSQAAAIARAVAGGDLTRVVALRSGDTSSIMAALNEMQESLAQIVASVRRGAEHLASASAEISHGNNDLSARTEQQASALEQTTAAMAQLSEAVNSTATSASQADQMAATASAVALKGGQAVHTVVDTMKGINDSSRKIAEITGVIDSIAFQTNILALNAAVEAARAGEQGRGFAVVASEVRVLAQRSADAAKQIKTLIADSVDRVTQGTQQVDRAGATMNEIVGSIGRVTAIMSEIRAASSEQNDGVSQVRSALQQMDSATQQNAALVEESAAASERLRVESEALVQAVAVFKLRLAGG